MVSLIADQLRPVTPDDLLVVFISSHGYTDTNGQFFVLPYDIGKDAPGKGEVSDSVAMVRLLDECISSDDLSNWLGRVDAGDMVLIFDTCQAGGSVAPPGYKHGPFGSRGLGQLAYDKGMRVLAGSTYDSDAYEPDALGNGLLTHVLVERGLRSSFEVDSESLTLGQLLGQAANRLPEIREAYLNGEIRGKLNGRPVRADLSERELNELAGLRRPILFDFKRRGRKITLSRVE